MKWPSQWKNEAFNDMTYLEIIPIALAIFLWGDRFQYKAIFLHCDNEAVVYIWNVKSSNLKE
jgi:hypothetical protein